MADQLSEQQYTPKPHDEMQERTGDDPNRFIRRGGKVNPQAIREAIEEAEQIGEEVDDGLRRVSFRLSKELNKRLDKYLTDRITFMSRNQLARLIDIGGVTVNGRKPKASTKLHRHDVVEVVVPPPPATEIQGEDIPLNILFEDEHLIVINKQAGLLVHPARSHQSGTLLNALVHHFQNASADPDAQLSSVGKDAARPGIIHRLDRWTSGVMTVGKDDEAHWSMGRQFENRTVDKRYLAVVQGVIETDADVIEAPLGPHLSKAKGMREKQMVRHDHLGKPAVTLYRVRERYVPKADNPSLRGYTLVELELKTGRTHQIRLHMRHLGYPLVGDDMYDGDLLDRAHIDASLGEGPLMHRQALHASLLGFMHPISKEKVEFQAPLPADLRELIGLLREYREPSGVLTFPGCTVDIAKLMGEEPQGGVSQASAG